jgi:RNA polymerase sigma-70 factor, ECF subfamily
MRPGGVRAFMPHMGHATATTSASAEEGHAPVPVDPSVTFEAFFDQHHERLYRALWLVTRNRHEAEEIAQDAFLKVWERWDRVASLDEPGGYLYRTSMNVFRSRRRRSAVALRRAVRQLPRDDELEAVEERDVVIRALAGLATRPRAAIVLTDLLGMSSEEAGEALGIRGGTVRVLLGRARAALRREMGDRHD